MELDLSNLTVVQVFTLSIVITLIDVASAVALSVIQGKFSAGAVAIWLQSHVLPREFPILALAIIGHGFGDVVPAIPLAFGLAVIGLTAYAIETIASLRDSFADASRPADESPEAN